MNKLILISLAIFVGATANVASAETAKQQKAKQVGLNTASQNQMLTQRLGTETMVKSNKLVIISKRFSSVSPTTSGTYTIGHIPKCNIITGSGYVSTQTALAQGVAATQVGVTVSGVALLPSGGIASAPAVGAAASATATLAGLSGCDRDIPVVMTVSGTLTSGRLDFIIPYIPYNQDL